MIDQPQGDKPALTVVIQSWWTPALAVIMLVVGLLAGYFGRPLIGKNSPTVVDVAATTTVSPTATVDAQQVKQLMDSIVSHTTHFQGDPNATVTLIEFSDYQ